MAVASSREFEANGMPAGVNERGYKCTITFENVLPIYAENTKRRLANIDASQNGKRSAVGKS